MIINIYVQFCQVDMLGLLYFVYPIEVMIRDWHDDKNSALTLNLIIFIKQQSQLDPWLWYPDNLKADNCRKSEIRGI